MNTYGQPYPPPPSHAVLSSKDDHQVVLHSRAYSSADSSARLLSSTHSRPKISRSQTYKATLKPRQLTQPDGIVNTLSIRNGGNGSPGTPVSPPSLSSSKDISPKSSTRRSPVTPTFIDRRPKDSDQGRSSPVRTRSLKSSREIEKSNISYPLSSSVYSAVPLTLDIRVDRDAYEPRREPPRPVGPLPQDLQSSYLEWDETSSKLHKMKQSMRMVGHGHRKQATSVTLDTRLRKSPDRCVNATPRTLPHSRHLPATEAQPQYQERPSHVSNFSRPTFQTPSNEEKWSRHLESNHKQTTSLHMCDWQEFLRSSLPSQEMRRSQEGNSILETVKDNRKVDVLCSQKSARKSRRITKSPPSTRGRADPVKADSPARVAAQQALTDLNTRTRSSIEHDRNATPQAPSFYTYHVTKRVDTTKPFAPSYACPQVDDAALLTSSQQSSSSVQDPFSHHTDDQNGSPRSRSFKTIVQGMAKKSSMSSLRRRATHSGAQR